MKSTVPCGRFGRFLASWIAVGSVLAAQTVKPAVSSSGDEVIKLEEFTVSGGQSGGYRATNAITATGIGAKIGDTPMAISVVNSELMKDLAAYDAREALNLVPGVLTNPRSESAVTIRGEAGLISYRNGQYRRQLMTTWNMDRVEVIKGPAAIFFGAVRPGGIVNYVSTKPSLSGTFTDVKVTVGNEEYARGEIFHNQKVNDKLAIRVGIGGYDVNGKRNYEYDHEYYMGLSALWKPTPNQQVTFDFEEINRQLFYLSAYPVRALVSSKVYGQAGAIAALVGVNRQNVTADTANRNYLTALGYSATFGATNFAPLYDSFAPYKYGDALAYDSTQWQEARAYDLDYLVKLGGGLVWQTTLNVAWDDTDGIQPSDGDTRPYADGSLRFRVEDFINIRDSYNAHSKLTYRFDVGTTKHTVQAGGEFQRVIFTRPAYLNSANQYNDSPGNTGSSATNPYVINFIPGVTNPVSLRSVIAASGQTFNLVRKNKDNAIGYFLVDQMSALNGRLFVLGGARYNAFNGKRQYSKPVSNSSISSISPGGLADYDRVAGKGGWTPQGGALVKVLPDVSVFASWSKSVEANTAVDADGVAAEPIKSRGLDFGVKSEVLDGRLSGSVTYYELLRENLSYNDTAKQTATGKSPYFIFGNAEQTKGVEFEANLSPVDNYQVIAGWSHNLEAKTIRSNNALLVGRRFGGIPENTYVLWNRYTFKTGGLKDFAIGLGLRHNDECNVSQDPNNAVMVPAFTVADAMASYKFRAFGRQISAQLNVKNLANKLYREGVDGYFGQARTTYLSFATKF